jgi:hypothetical protein
MISRIVGRTVLALATALCCLSLSRGAAAGAGTITGTYRIWNKNGNYCDPNPAPGFVHNCTGSNYPKSQYDTLQPLKNAHVELWQGGGAIGQGVTDDNGNFLVQWSSSNLTTPVWVRWFAQQKDNRFIVEDMNSLRMNNNSGSFTLINGTTVNIPQNIGSWYSGSSAGPQWYMNIYWAAEKEWRETFNLVGLFQNGYTNVQIRGEQNCSGGDSCATGSTKSIQIGGGVTNEVDAYTPQAVVMHEGGHIADFVARSYTNGENYCYPGTTGGQIGGVQCGWNATVDAWGATSFEEGFATLAANVTLWYPNAVEPTYCRSQGTCGNADNTNLEVSHAINSACLVNSGNNESRKPISTMRMLWDLYDIPTDTSWDSLSEGAGAFWQMWSIMTFYPAGTGIYAIDEPWSANYAIEDNYDGRGSISYYHNYVANYASQIAMYNIWWANCSPY